MSEDPGLIEELVVPMIEGIEGKRCCGMREAFCGKLTGNRKTLGGYNHR
ncbi:hypothetical protein [Roseburia intestinalis]